MRGVLSRLFLFLVAVLTMSIPVRALACACCSHEGEYYRGVGKIENFQLELMKEMRFDSEAQLFVTEADMEDIAKGITAPKETYSLTGALVRNAWKLTFRDGTRSGVLSLPLPFRMETLKADIRDGQTSPGGGPLLYKEWRFDGRVNGTGFFRNGIVGTTRYTLLLQGRGNGCDNSEDFKTWRLQVEGKNASFAFYGKLAKPK